MLTQKHETWATYTVCEITVSLINTPSILWYDKSIDFVRERHRKPTLKNKSLP